MDRNRPKGAVFHRLSTPVELHHRLEGPENAPVLMLSSSLGTDYRLWEPQLAALASRYRVLRYDMRGHGSSAVPSGPYTIETLGRDALALLDALRMARVSFCGLSIGGMIGLWLAAHASERIERLVLANTSSYVGSPETWNARLEAVRRGGVEAIADGMMERWFTPEFRTASPQVVERIRAMLVATPPAGYIACGAAVRDMDLRDALPHIAAPTLVICGKRDPSIPPEHGRFLAERVRDAQLVELPTAHLSNVEASAAFTDNLLAFLRTSS